MTVVSNTSPLNYLVLIDYQEILPALFGHVLIPEAVWHELRSPAAPQPVKAFLETWPSWLERRIVSQVSQDLQQLDPGEREAIAAAILKIEVQLGPTIPPISPDFRPQFLGFGLSQTELTVPLSRSLALVGSDEAPSISAEIPLDFVRVINQRTMAFASRFPGRAPLWLRSGRNLLMLRVI